MNLQGMMEHFFGLYGRRNRIFLQGLGSRIDFLNLAVGDLQNAIRQEASDENMSIALARTVSRVACIAEHFIDLPLIDAMVTKYGNGCGYCLKIECECPEKRPETHFGRADSITAHRDQRHAWPLRSWSEHLEILYGKKNLERGIENVLLRLFKEASELQSLSMRLTTGSFEGDLDEIEWQFALELADALAWTIGVANLLGINLETAVLQRFGESCWKCRLDPCQCTAFNMEPVDWSEPFV